LKVLSLPPNGLAFSRATRPHDATAARPPAGRREPAKGAGCNALLGRSARGIDRCAR
jgi:hypothetical protein